MSSSDKDRLTLSIVNGITLTPYINQKMIDDLADFTFLPSDVLIVTYPKSGTSWVQQIVTLIKNEGGDIDTHIFAAIPWLELVGKEGAKAIPSPRIVKSHLPYHMMSGGEPIKTTAKYIYIARNPKDVAVSFYYHALRWKCYEFTGDWNCFFELFMKGEVDFGLYFDHVLEWWKHRDADNILFLKYEDMKKDLPGCVKNISQFMGYNLDESVIAKIAENSTFDSMKDNPLANPDDMAGMKDMIVDNSSTSFLRKGIVGDWRNHFSDEQSARLDAEYAKRMTGSGLDFEF